MTGRMRTRVDLAGHLGRGAGALLRGGWLMGAFSRHNR